MPENQKSLDRKYILKLLGKLNQKMSEKGVYGDILIAGGSAIALNHNSLRVTTDIDALIKPYNEIYQLAEDIAMEENIGKDWINDQVRYSFRRTIEKDKNPKTIAQLSNLTISVVSPNYLLAMKLGINMLRPYDYDDILTLMYQTGNTTKKQLEIVVKNVYGQRLFDKNNAGWSYATNFNKNISAVFT
jgi:hypothetical protein